MAFPFKRLSISLFLGLRGQLLILHLHYFARVSGPLVCKPPHHGHDKIAIIDFRQGSEIGWRCLQFLYSQASIEPSSYCV